MRRNGLCLVQKFYPGTGTDESSVCVGMAGVGTQVNIPPGRQDHQQPPIVTPATQGVVSPGAPASKSQQAVRGGGSAVLPAQAPVAMSNFSMQNLQFLGSCSVADTGARLLTSPSISPQAQASNVRRRDWSECLQSNLNASSGHTATGGWSTGVATAVVHPRNNALGTRSIECGTLGLQQQVQQTLGVGRAAVASVYTPGSSNRFAGGVHAAAAAPAPHPGVAGNGNAGGFCGPGPPHVIDITDDD